MSSTSALTAAAAAAAATTTTVSTSAVAAATIGAAVVGLRRRLVTKGSTHPTVHASSPEMRSVLEKLQSLLLLRSRLAFPECLGLASTLSLGLRRPPPPANVLRVHTQPPDLGHRAAAYHDETLVRLADGGTVRLSWRRHDGALGTPCHGVVLVLPGLNNDSSWAFVQHTAALCCRRGLDAAVCDYRGVGGQPLTSARLGCADSWRDLEAVIVAVRARCPGQPLFGIGQSMGGLMLSKFLSVVGASSPFAACCLVSAPLDASAHMARLESTAAHRVVNASMALGATLGLARLGVDAEARRQLRGRLSWAAVASSAPGGLRALEAASICPLHGYADPEDYYAFCKPTIADIATPLLVLHAEDDPVIGAADLPLAELRANPHVALVLTRSGGHLGFASGARHSGSSWDWAREASWADAMCARFLLLHARDGKAEPEDTRTRAAARSRL